MGLAKTFGLCNFMSISSAYLEVFLENGRKAVSLQEGRLLGDSILVLIHRSEVVLQRNIVTVLISKWY